ncbi:Transport and Golgi organisation 2 [Dyadobacter soli]|uniref:Transport and Golgi organisation 2 n=1 Tax=Dyadobacter soli TaxID=659014 RepID=A0A1G7AC38_9BACT|nr:NRDE family protein [Dyadobacter soli]SDE12320.1 Transport and Golgi organisation 2 [Dyadobacter soli]
MCTVTYIPTERGAFLTSNRDERTDRTPAEPPVTRSGGDSLLYPRDAHAGGTWIAMKGRRDAAVLLNGGFTNHRREPFYRKSRGIVMLEIIDSTAPTECFASMPLEGIEPFTLILFIRGALVRCTWDGIRKHCQELDSTRPHIWASATLYGREAQEMRVRSLQNWFAKTTINTRNVLDFHLQDDIRFNASQSFHSNRAAMATVSVTSIDLDSEEPAVYYHDLLSEKWSVSVPQPGPASTPLAFDSFRWKIKRFLIRARSWEYWPLVCVYLPMVPLWLWLSVKARSFWFFGAANPSMRYAGFTGESKYKIYSLMPRGSYPETVRCEAGCSLETMQSLLINTSLKLPLMAKPDIGERGTQVKLLETPEGLEQYRLRSWVNFLLQPYIDYPNEAGIFYHRMPGNDQGQLSGIVGKELLSVSGDGKSDILTFIMQDERAILQLPELHRALGDKLGDIPAAGKNVLLVPYGNHSRGARFVDLSHRISPALTRVIDNICSSIPGFYFGRLDIRFKSWEDLEAGRHFSVIELNGAASEPTHIYDPIHSIFFAWKEIYKHWEVLCQISITNSRNGIQGMCFKDGLEMLREHSKRSVLTKQKYTQFV